MKFDKNLKNLEEYVLTKNDKLLHKVKKTAPLLPFKTSNNAEFDKGFDMVVAPLSRIICNNSLDSEVKLKNILKDIKENVEIKVQNEGVFEQLIKMFLYDNKYKINVFHPFIYQYFESNKSEEDIALFIRDVLVEDNNNFKNFFKRKKLNNILAKLIIKQLPSLKNRNNSSKYKNKLIFMKNIFNEDLNYLLDYEKYFNNNIDLFLAYYYFFYITQLTLKLDKQEKANYNKPEKVYYTLDWEVTSKTRKSYKFGYKNIGNKSKDYLFVHMNCLAHLNFLFNKTGATYDELKETFDKMDDVEQNKLLEILKKWIKEYRNYKSLSSIEKLTFDYNTLVSKLKESLESGIPNAAKGRFGNPIEIVGKQYFLKTRGPLGFMLNVTQDFLLLITALSVKKKRKTLSKVFKEYEKRGLFFDRKSQESIVNLFDKLNLLDKKSDSGDAQYVKPIL